MRKFLTSIWILALLIAIPVIILTPSFFEKFKVEEISKRNNLYNFYNSRVYYADLDGDGKKERVESGDLEIRKLKKHVVQVKDNKPLVVFYGKYSDRLTTLFFDDTNNNGLDEIFGFSTSGDSLFLNVAESHVVNKNLNVFKTEKYFVPFISNNEGYGQVVMLDNGYFDDLNNDGFNELVFSLKYYGESMQMAVLAFNWQSKSFTTTEIIGDRNINIRPFDIDNDGINEIISDGQSMGFNTDSTINLSSGFPYLKVYGNNLDFKIPPRKFPDGSIYTLPVNFEGTTQFYCLYTSGQVDVERNTLYKLSENGKVVDSLNLSIENGTRFPWISKKAKNEFWLYLEKGEIYVVNDNLEIEETIYLGNENEEFIFSRKYDINEDKQNEYLGFDIRTGDCFVFVDDFSERIEIRNALFMPAGLDVKIGKNQFYVYDKEFSYVYRFSKNPYRHLAIPIYLFIYLISVLIVFVIRKAQEASVREKMELKRKVHNLQMRTLKNQLDPHFMFNTFNTIASVIKQGRNDEAYDLFVILSKMVRKNLDHSDEIYTTLKEELEFVEDYLSIQKFRFKTMFRFSIQVEKAVHAHLMIPKMLVQIHVENAFKHGLRNSKKEGKLLINVFVESTTTVIKIEDNGVGREKSLENNTQGNGIGLKTIEQIIEVNNKNGESKIIQQINDLKDQDGNSLGTQIVLRISE